MSDLKLVNPQKMETLPFGEQVYLQVREQDVPFLGHSVEFIHTATVRLYGLLLVYTAWSREATDATATFEKGEG